MHVGVDFGDIWMRAARVSGPQCSPSAIPDLREPRELATRLCVQIDTHGALVGEIAVELQRENPTATVIDDLRSKLATETTFIRDVVNREWSAEGLVGLCLRKLRRDISGLVSDDWNTATFTVSADSSNQFRERLRSAARLAGLSQICLIEEPVAVWHFVNASAPRHGLSLIVQVDESSSVVTLLDGKDASPRILCSNSLSHMGSEQARLRVAEQLIRDIDPAAVRDFNSGVVMQEEVLRQLRRERVDSLTSTHSVQRRAWLIQGTVCDVLLRRSLWEQAWAPIRERLIAVIRQSAQHFGGALGDIKQIIFAGNSVSKCDIRDEVASLFPQASLWHQPELAAWLPAYGASLIGSSHPAWQIDKPSITSLGPLPEDVGVLILNPVSRQPDLDVMLLKGAQPLTRATRHYQPQPGQSMFIIELVMRQAASPGYQTLSRWEVPLSSQNTRSTVQFTCEFRSDRALEATITGDFEASTDLARTISLGDTSTSIRESAQQLLVEATPWRD